MATTGSMLTEEQLLCPICLELLNQPVSTPCGHNFCKDCIHGYWQSANLTQCPVCKYKFRKRPELKVNTFISEVVSQFNKSLEQKDENETGAVDPYPSYKWGVSCDVCLMSPVKAHKSCLDCLASFCETHLEPHHVLGTFRMHRLIDPTLKMQDRVCRKHEKLITLFCHNDQTYVCDDCVKDDHHTHHTVPIEEESKDRRAQVLGINKVMGKKIQDRVQKIRDINQVVEHSRRNTETELKESLKIFNKLLQLVQRGQAEVAEVIGSKQKLVESKAGRLIAELKQEISELEQLSHTQDDLYFLHSFQAFSKDWSDLRLESAVYVGMLRRAVRRVACQLEATVRDEVTRLSEAEFHRAQQSAVDVTLDPDSAHPKLVLNENRKQVHHGDEALTPPDDPKRFYPGVSVLGREGFTSGSFYFEVQVKGKTEWDIGVALESVNRKGGNMLYPESGYWAMGMRQGESYWALSSTPIRVPLIEKPQRVGVYVDVEDGQVSFYNVDTASHIYSFTGYSFSDRLVPYFNPRRNHDGVNSAPLIISPVDVKC
ncbi:zinc-binding protein A33-like [Halichoeres trimaculatus]|uniref:zinc-binding protein A33-like n=1 Tax=Halichoeres trimaculatus TaxID=147232 RepID=UPI003D9E1E98